MLRLTQALMRSGSSRVQVQLRARLCVLRQSACPFSAAATTSKLNMALVKQLRETSGAPITECRDALNSAMSSVTNTADDSILLKEALDVLRKKGLSSASKKAGRGASEGLVSVSIGTDRRSASIAEVNSETDFAARNERFINTVSDIGDAVLHVSAAERDENGDIPLERILNAKLLNGSQTVNDSLTDALTALRENLVLRRANHLKVDQGIIGGYIHNAAISSTSPVVTNQVAFSRAGRTGCIVALSTSKPITEENQSTFIELANKLAMQIVAAPPQYLRRTDIPQNLIDHERQVLRGAAAASAKDPTKIDRMVEGRLGKFFEENVLLDQKLVILTSPTDKSVQISSFLEQESKRLQNNITIAAFVRYTVGEGIAKNKVDFAEEVKSKLSK